MNPRSAVALVVISLGLASCGGGGTGADAPYIAKASDPAPLASGPANVAPVASTASFTLLEDASLDGTLSAHDADGGTLVFTAEESPAHGTLTLDLTGQFHFAPAANYFGTDRFVFTVHDAAGATDSAAIEIRIDAVNDAPTIVIESAPSFVASGATAAIPARAVDAEDGTVNWSVAQTAGPAASGVVASAAGFSLRAPQVSAAQEMSFELRAADRDGFTSTSVVTLTVGPVSQSGKLLTLAGSPTSPGLHWVMTGDGFSADEQDLLVRTARDMAQRVLLTPELARHAGVWNVHLLKAVSRDSGVDGETRGQLRNTAYDGAVACNSVERIACVSWDKVLAAVLPELPGYDALGVILNSQVYIGSSNASGVLVSRHAFGPEVMLHEMGHLVAGLADEYVDASIQAPRYVEGRYPNVTRITDVSRIPWRHWFSDPTRIPMSPGSDGVGRFEGAYYTQSGYFRPKNDSIMRTVTAPLGEVNAEAWIRAEYRAVPPIVAAQPAAGAVHFTTGSSVDLSVDSLFRGAQELRWYLDDVEIAGARDASSFRYLSTDAGAHWVRVTAQDVSGIIRDPAAQEHIGNVSWYLVPTGAPAGTLAGGGVGKAATRTDAIDGWVRMRVDASGHHAVDLWREPLAEPHRRPLPGARDLPVFAYQLQGAAGEVLAAGEVADPRLVHGPLPLPGDPQAGHDFLMLEEGSYLIGIPAGTAPVRLKIRRQSVVTGIETESMAKDSTATEQLIDLASLR